jgi:CRP-like cAMP-binding protein
VKSFNWADLLRHHPIFSVLTADEIEGLLPDTASREHGYSAGQVIMQVGEVGDSIYLVGAGAVDATLPLEGDQRLPLSTMRKGEIFGEMAFLEGRPRSATVVVRET